MYKGYRIKPELKPELNQIGSRSTRARQNNTSKPVRTIHQRIINIKLTVVKYTL